MIARRRAIAVGLAVIAALVVVWAAVRRYAPGDVHTGSAAAHGATILRYDVHSRFVHRTLPQTAAIPKGADGERRYLRFYADALATC